MNALHFKGAGVLHFGPGVRGFGRGKTVFIINDAAKAETGSIYGLTFSTEADNPAEAGGHIGGVGFRAGCRVYIDAVLYCFIDAFFANF